MATAPLSTVQEHPSFPTATQSAQVSAVFNGQLDSRTGNALPDVIIRSSDNIYFAVHARRLLSTSKNGFASLLTASSTPTITSPIQVTVEEPADVLNVVLHTVYGLSADAHEPSLQCLRAALQALEKYGITPLDRYITTNTPLFNTILTLATARPFETYGLASQYKLEALAVAVSSRTLTTKMHTMNADVAGTINVVYLQRLYGLHQDRRNGMKAINATPVFHGNLPDCGNEKQQETWLEFQYACGTLFMAAPAITREQIETSLNERIEATACGQCKASLIGERDRIMEAFDALVTTI